MTVYDQVISKNGFGSKASISLLIPKTNQKLTYVHIPLTVPSTIKGIITISVDYNE